MIIGQNGAITPEQSAAMEQRIAAEREANRLEAKEIDRLKSLSNRDLLREVYIVNHVSGKTNHLAFAYSLLVLADLSRHLGVQFPNNTNDPYKLRHPKPAKKTRRKGATA